MLTRAAVPTKKVVAVAAVSAASARKAFFRSTRQEARVVVVTGIGAVTPLGATFPESYRALLRNRSGVTSLGTALKLQFDNGNTESNENSLLARELELSKQLPCQVAAAAPLPPSNQGGEELYNPRTTARFVQFGLLAAQEALDHAGLLSAVRELGAIDKSRVGVSMGSGMSSVREIVKAAHLPSFRKLSPYFVPLVLSNSAAGRVAIQYGLQGPNLSASTACAASTHAIGDAVRCIQHGQADVMLAGGAEAAIDTLSLAGFSRLKALSTKFNDTPELASRPFDKDRDGFVMGEGGAILILEELQHALRRREKNGSDFNILAIVSGYGASGDGYHITAPDADGVGAKLCMQRALDEAAGATGFQNPASSVYVNAHSTSTPKGDEIETRAIERIFFKISGTDRHLTPDRVLVSSTKGATGHLLGAAGAVEAAFTIQALRDQCAPSTLNLQQPDVDLAATSELELVQGDAEPVPTLQVALSNSFGFGGTNACLVFERWGD